MTVSNIFIAFRKKKKVVSLLLHKNPPLILYITVNLDTIFMTSFSFICDDFYQQCRMTRGRSGHLKRVTSLGSEVTREK